MRRNPPLLARTPIVQRAIWLAIYDAQRSLTAREIAVALTGFGFPKMSTAKINPHLQSMVNLQTLRRLPRKAKNICWKYRLVEEHRQ